MKRVSNTSRLRRIRFAAFALAAISTTTLVLSIVRFNFSEQSYPILATIQRITGVNQPTAEHSGVAPQIIGHRGSALDRADGNGTVGNTMTSIRAGIDSGADWIEIDIRQSSDGVLMVFHDDSVERATNGTGKVRKLTQSELQTLHISVTPKEPIPTLTTVLDEFSSDNVKFILDIKVANLRDELLPVVEEHLRHEQIILFGSYDILLEYVDSGFTLGYTALWSEHSNGYWFLFGQSFLLERCKTLRCQYLVLPNILLNKSLIDGARNKGIEVWSYGSDNELDWRHCAHRGITGLIADHPENAVRLFGSP